MNAFLILPPASPFIIGMRARSPTAFPLFFLSSLLPSLPSSLPSYDCKHFWHPLRKIILCLDFLLFSFIQTHQDNISGSGVEPCNSNTKICLPGRLSIPNVGKQGKEERDTINWTVLKESDSHTRDAT